MSKQSIFRGQATNLALRSTQRPRPLTSSAVALSSYSRKSQANTIRTFHQQVAWTRRTSACLSAAVDTPSLRWFSSEDDSKKQQEDEPAAAEEPTPTKGDKKSDGDEECPPWQNPLHHNDPENEKFFPEDFGPEEEMVYMEAPPLADPNDPDKILASQEIYDLADEIVNLSMLEMKDLVNKIGDHFEFEEPPFTGPGGGGGGGDGEEEDGDGVEAAAEKTAFDLKLVSFDAKSKIKVIKEVRALAGLGLKEAKELVEGAPKVVMKDINKEMAEELQKKLEEVGATVEIV